jgi:hypothetical protein
LANKSFNDANTFFIDEADNAKKLQFQLSNITSGVTRTLTVPDQNGTIAVTSDIGNGTLTLDVSGVGISGSASFTANQFTATTFTVTSNATSANTGGAIVARDANGDFNTRNVNASYVVTTDDINTGTITHVIAKFGDNNHRSATAAKLAEFLSGQSLNVAGNAATATKVQATATGTNSAELVRGNMADNDQFRILVGATASNAGYVEIATADDGNEPIYVRQYSGVFTTLSRTATLLDANGNTSFPGSVTATEFTITTPQGTSPLSITSTTKVANLNADLLDGLDVHTGRNNEANKIVRTQADGYIDAGWINTTSGDNGTTAIDRVYASSDGYIRYYTPTNFRTVLDVPTRGGSGASGTWDISVSGNAATVTNGVYTSGDQTIAGIKTFTSTIGGSINGNAGSVTNGVYTSGDQTIAGTKTFSSTISGSIDGNASTVTNGVYTSGNQTIAGTKTFSSTISGSINGNASSVSNGVYTVGDQTIAGTKTFSSTISGSINGDADSVDGQNFTYSNSSNSPTWIWGSNSNGTSFLASRAALSVSYADSAGSAGSASTAGSASGNSFSITGTSPTINFVDTDNAATRYVHHNSNLIGFLGSTGGWIMNVNDSGTVSATLFSGTATTARYADLAENYLADAKYVEGTVLVLGGAQEVTISSTTHAPEVVGIVSTNPAHLMNSELTGEHVVAVALTGRVPCRVTGKIKKGDRLVASHIAGVACAYDKALYEPGCIIGKALEDFDGEEGVIEVVVGRV